jgi:hypothetical protein
VVLAHISVLNLRLRTSDVGRHQFYLCGFGRNEDLTEDDTSWVRDKTSPTTFETEMLAEEESYGSLGFINRELIGKAEAIDAPQRIRGQGRFEVA